MLLCSYLQAGGINAACGVALGKKNVACKHAQAKCRSCVASDSVCLAPYRYLQGVGGHVEGV